MKNMNKISLVMLGVSFLWSSAFGSNTFVRTLEDTLKTTFKMCIDRGSEDDAKALYELEQHKNRSNISCIVHKDGSYKERKVVAAGYRRLDGGKYIIRPEEKECWDLIKANYPTLQYDADLSKPRDSKVDAYGNLEYLVFKMGNPTVFVVTANQSNQISEFVKKINTK